MTAEELNEHIARGTVNEVIRVAEAKQVKALSMIADEICHDSSIRLVLVAGASAAGKTTTAKRICTQLRVNDHEALHLSTDDYFVGDELNPRDEDGKLDYEHVECVDIRRLASDINALLRGESVPERRFDFVKHAPYNTDRLLTLPEGSGMIVLEGIHALNPRLTEGIDDAMKFRVFIEPRPQLDVFGGFFPSSRDARFLRRMVRDNQFRKRNPSETLEMWPSVIRGEERWIEPFRQNADAVFNSYLIYELAALKPFVGGLLERVRREKGEDRMIVSLIGMLETVEPLSPEAIPGDSILRETIGGSQLEY